MPKQLTIAQKNWEKTGEGIPFTGRCETYIETQRFLNIAAAPVVFEGTRLGVLKMENKEGTTKEQSFPPEDFALAQVLARIIGVVCQQRTYTRLWLGAEMASEKCKSETEYLDQIAEILRKALNAECCSLWIPSHDDESVLTFGGGVGYKQNYRDLHSYRLSSNPESLTAYIAQRRTTIRATEHELSSEPVPYTGACASYIASGDFQNVLGLALVESPEKFGNLNAKCWGVLKVENKKPEGAEFGRYDEEVCKAFVVKQIAPTLKTFRTDSSKGQASKAGIRLLTKTFGSPPDREDPDWGTRFDAVVSFKDREKGNVTWEGCYTYLKIPQINFFQAEDRKKKS